MWTGHGLVGIRVCKWILGLSPSHCILWTELRHLLWLKEFAGLCSVDLSWELCFIVFSTLYFWVRICLKRSMHRTGEQKSRRAVILRNLGGKTVLWTDREVPGEFHLSSMLHPACPPSVGSTSHPALAAGKWSSHSSRCFPWVPP